jgi:hypothetical protein
LSERAHTEQTEAAGVERGDRRGPAEPAPVPGVWPAAGLAGHLIALQQSAGNRAVQRLLQRHPADATLQRHPEHAPEEEEIQRRVAQREAVPLQRHPEHAPEEEEIQRVAAAAVQRESKKKLKARMTKEYGKPFSGDLPKAMLERLDKILSRLPRSHTAGNAALKDISGGGGIGANTSAYDSDTEEIEINVPEIKPGVKMPWWLYLLLDKGIKKFRAEMDKGAMSDFKIDTGRDAELNLTGKREVMGGVSDVLARERLVDWTVRHEMGHSVDQQIKFMTTRGRLNMFGGWQMHDTYDRRKEVAKAFLLKAGFDDSESAKLLDTATDFLRVRPTGPTKMQDAPDETAKLLGVPAASVSSKFQAFDDAAAVATAHPWTFSDGGGQRVTHDGRMYHVDHYGTWVSYLSAARADALSNYQFSSPGEWFAESYAAFYDPKKSSPARARMPADVREWFTANLGPPASSRAGGAKSSGELADDKGKLGELKDLDDAVAAALNDPKKMVTVDKADLPEEFRYLAPDS